MRPRHGLFKRESDRANALSRELNPNGIVSSSPRLRGTSWALGWNPAGILRCRLNFFFIAAGGFCVSRSVTSASGPRRHPNIRYPFSDTALCSARFYYFAHEQIASN